MAYSVGLVFLMVVFLSIGFGYYLVSPGKKGAQSKVFLVREGSTLREVTRDLEKQDLISNKTLLLLWARLRGYGKMIKAGEYSLTADMPPVKILNTLTRGAIITHPVTIPEGYTRKQIAVLLEWKGLVKANEFLSLTQNSEIAKRYGISGDSLEGYLYPDTYHFGRGLSAHAIIDTMVTHFMGVIEPLRKRLGDSGMTLKEVLILASIVEKETGSGEERPLIASVFLNRLKKRMRLESDPTVIYGIKDFDGNLTRKHLAKKTPYNTYVIRGLPRGPIANPGIEAIRAVLYPAVTKYLYFVSKNDGTHYFSKTLSEHNRAVKKYQMKRRRRQKKSS